MPKQKYLIAVMAVLFVLLPIFSQASTLSQLEKRLSILQQKVAQLFNNQVGGIVVVAKATPPGGPYVNLIPDPAVIVDACANSTNKLTCYKAWWRFSCSWPVAIYDTEYQTFSTNIIDPINANIGNQRLISSCANFCYRYSRQAGFADELSCRKASFDFVSGNQVMSTGTTGQVNLKYPINTDPDAFSISKTKITTYCNQILTDLGMPLSHNWNNNCRQAITSFLTSTTPTPTWYNMKLIGYQKFLKDRLGWALKYKAPGSVEHCVYRFGKKVVGERLGFQPGADPNSSLWGNTSFGCCAKTSECYSAGRCYSAGEMITSPNNGNLFCSVADSATSGHSAFWCPQGLANNGRYCAGTVNQMVDNCLKKGWCSTAN